MINIYDENTGLPLDQGYLECALPPYLQESLEKYKIAEEKKLNGEKHHYWDCYYCELQSSINVAEVENEITSDQAWYLREKYLGLKKEQNI